MQHAPTSTAWQQANGGLTEVAHDRFLANNALGQQPPASTNSAYVDLSPFNAANTHPCDNIYDATPRVAPAPLPDQAPASMSFEQEMGNGYAAIPALPGSEANILLPSTQPPVAGGQVATQADLEDFELDMDLLNQLLAEEVRKGFPVEWLYQQP